MHRYSDVTTVRLQKREYAASGAQGRRNGEPHGRRALRRRSWIASRPATCLACAAGITTVDATAGWRGRKGGQQAPGAFCHPLGENASVPKELPCWPNLGGEGGVDPPGWERLGAGALNRAGDMWVEPGRFDRVKSHEKRKKKKKISLYSVNNACI
jgi:hypothetical protein